MDSDVGRGYVLNLFEQIDNVDIDPKDYYDMMANVDAQVNSQVESPEPQAYVSEVTAIDDASSSLEIVEPRTHAQAVDPRNELHKE